MNNERFFDGDQWRLLKQRSNEALLGDRWFLLGYAGFWFVLVVLVISLMAFVDAEADKVFPRFGLLTSSGAFWMGAVLGARALVMERAMFIRECAAAHLNVAAYLGSKVHSLSLLGIVAVTVYLPVVQRQGGSDGGVMAVVPIGWLLIALLATMVCGVCFGLMISAFSRSVVKSQIVVVASLLVMLLLAGGEGNAYSRVEMIFQWLSPLRWPRASLMQYGAEMPNDMLATGHLLPLVWFSVVFLGAAYMFLKRQGYGDCKR